MNHVIIDSGDGAVYVDGYLVGFISKNALKERLTKFKI